MNSMTRCISRTTIIVAIVVSVFYGGMTPSRCNAICIHKSFAGGSPQDELSAEEAKSVKIADRFFSILEKSPRRGTALERVYGHHVEFGTLDEFLQGLRDRTKNAPEDGTTWMLLGMFEAHRGEDSDAVDALLKACLLYTSPSPRDRQKSRMPSSA